MAHYNHLSVFQKSYDLVLETYKTTHNFSREYKYSLGQKIKEISAEIIDSIVLINSERDKIDHFRRLRSGIERLRIHLRIAYDLKILKIKRFEFLNRIIEDVSRQSSGWEKWFIENFSRIK